MNWNVWDKIEWVREQPEHVRKRYVMLCLAISMAFIFAVWLLSLKSSFQHVSSDIPSAVEQGKELLPNGQLPALDSLLEQTKPLDVGRQSEKTGQEYFNEQFQQSAQ